MHASAKDVHMSREEVGIESCACAIIFSGCGLNEGFVFPAC
jgi:hypothetical protein